MRSRLRQWHPRAQRIEPNGFIQRDIDSGIRQNLPAIPILFGSRDRQP